MKIHTLMYKFIINGQGRVIPKRLIKEDLEDSFIAFYYYNHYIHVWADEKDRGFEKPWYAQCQAADGSYIVDGWVGKTKEEAIKVCLENIFFKP